MTQRGKAMNYVKRISDLKKVEAPISGGKAANLGELTRHGFRVPKGFTVTGPSLEYLLDVNNLMPHIRKIIRAMDFDDYHDIEIKSEMIRDLIRSAPLPCDLLNELKEQIERMQIENGGEDPFVAVRSSVSVRETSVYSFPGMMDTFPYIKGERQIIGAIRDCWASLYTARAVYRRHQQDIGQDRGVIAPIVQKMVDSDVSGVLFTANPVTGNCREIIIESNWGLGESVVSGEANADHFVLCRDKPLRVKMKKIMPKEIMITIDNEKGCGRKRYDLKGHMISDCTLTENQLMELGELGLSVEKVFSYPQNVEWAYENDILYLLQSRNIKALKTTEWLNLQNMVFDCN